MFMLHKCHFKASGDCVEFLAETKAKWGKTHILVKSNSLCSDGSSLHKTTFPQLSNSFASQLSWSLGLWGREERRGRVSGGCCTSCHLTTDEKALERTEKSAFRAQQTLSEKVHAPNWKATQSCYFQTPECWIILQTIFTKSIKDKKFSSRPLLLIIASLKHCLAFWVLVRLGTKLPKRGSDSVLAWFRRLYQ